MVESTLFERHDGIVISVAWKHLFVFERITPHSGPPREMLNMSTSLLASHAPPPPIRSKSFPTSPEKETQLLTDIEGRLRVHYSRLLQPQPRIPGPHAHHNVQPPPHTHPHAPSSFPCPSRRAPPPLLPLTHASSILAAASIGLLPRAGISRCTFFDIVCWFSRSAGIFSA